MTLTRSARTAKVWCIVDNTAEGAATANALDVLARVPGGLTVNSARNSPPLPLNRNVLTLLDKFGDQPVKPVVMLDQPHVLGG
jgi:hypothetical protein